MTDDICVMHDQLTTMGGAERVGFELAREFDAPMYAARVDDETVPDAVETHEITGRVGSRLMRSHYLLQDLYQMLAWQHVDDVYEYETVIQNKNNPGWFVPRDTQTVIRYCHSTPRTTYDRFHAVGGGLPSRVLEMIQRHLYLQNVLYPDHWVANSELVARRLERYWNIPSEDIDVVYPPVNVSQTSPDTAETRDYYLVVSRLRGHKRIDEIIQSFDGRDDKLVIVGDGPDRDRLAKMSGDNVVMTGYVPDKVKARRLSEAKAVIFNAMNEDFGMVPIEAMAAGTPVIGVDEGFTTHQIFDGQNGHLYLRGRLSMALDRFEDQGVEWSDEQIAEFAQQFSQDRFREEMRAIVSQTTEGASVSVDLEQPMPKLETPAVADGGDVDV
jgi:glycosyltransferase involved in cell wall biosynthesis